MGGNPTVVELLSVTSFLDYTREVATPSLSVTVAIRVSTVDHSTPVGPDSSPSLVPVLPPPLPSLSNRYFRTTRSGRGVSVLPSFSPSTGDFGHVARPSPTPSSSSPSTSRPLGGDHLPRVVYRVLPPFRTDTTVSVSSPGLSNRPP